MVRKACSTFEAFFAEVSRNGIPKLSANSCFSLSLSGDQGESGGYEQDEMLAGPPYLRHRVLDDFLV